MTTASLPAPDRGSLASIVGGNVRALLAVRKVSQVQLAEILGVTQSAVSKRLRGVTPFDTNDLEAIATAFGVPPMELLNAQFSPGISRHPFVTVGYGGLYAGFRRQLGVTREVACAMPPLRMVPPLPLAG